MCGFVRQEHASGAAGTAAEPPAAGTDPASEAAAAPVASADSSAVALPDGSDVAPHAGLSLAASGLDVAAPSVCGSGEASPHIHAVSEAAQADTERSGVSNTHVAAHSDRSATESASSEQPAPLKPPAAAAPQEGPAEVPEAVCNSDSGQQDLQQMPLPEPDAAVPGGARDSTAQDVMAKTQDAVEQDGDGRTQVLRAIVCCMLSAGAAPAQGHASMTAVGELSATT